MIIHGDRYYTKYSGNTLNILDPTTRHVFGEFCINFKDTIFEDAMREGLMQWARSNQNVHLEEMVKILYGEKDSQKLVEPLKFDSFNFESD